jgi:hypothetical protein
MRRIAALRRERRGGGEELLELRLLFRIDGGLLSSDGENAPGGEEQRESGESLQSDLRGPRSYRVQFESTLEGKTC